MQKRKKPRPCLSGVPKRCDPLHKNFANVCPCGPKVFHKIGKLEAKLRHNNVQLEQKALF